MADTEHTFGSNDRSSIFRKSYSSKIY